MRSTVLPGYRAVLNPQGTGSAAMESVAAVEWVRIRHADVDADGFVTRDAFTAVWSGRGWVEVLDDGTTRPERARLVSLVGDPTDGQTLVFDGVNGYFTPMNLIVIPDATGSVWNPRPATTARVFYVGPASIGLPADALPNDLLVTR